MIFLVIIVFLWSGLSSAKTMVFKSNLRNKIMLGQVPVMPANASPIVGRYITK